MSKTEIKNKIEELQNRQFLIQMKDHWSADDFQKDRKLTAEIRELKTLLNEGE